MNWLILALAGLVEVAWSQSIKPTQNFTRPLPTLLCLVLMARDGPMSGRASSPSTSWTCG
ncbi:DMT family transporter [Nonomuraea insulae]|uniref:DMT family transporter n=1 Tax=Nonomuraea insulae TaxID=1616787 RepID=A0ABW1CT67_9ACTN